MVAARFFLSILKFSERFIKKGNQRRTNQVKVSFATDTAQKRSFSFRIFSVSVTKSQENADLVTFTEQIFNGNFIFCVVQKLIELITKDYLVA